MKPKETIAAFDAHLARRDLELEAVVVGDAALCLLGIVDRATRDVDVLRPELPALVQEAAREFARMRQEQGDELQDNWLNNGPVSLAGDLSEGWETRTIEVFRGSAVILWTLGRTDLLGSKLCALCDRGIDLQYCLAMAPTRDELAEIEPWLVKQDANEEWPQHVRAVLEDLGQRLGHGI